MCDRVIRLPGENEPDCSYSELRMMHAEMRAEDELIPDDPTLAEELALEEPRPLTWRERWRRAEDERDRRAIERIFRDMQTC